VIYRVEPGSGAARAGLQGLSRDRLGRYRLGDVIQTVDGEPVRSNADLLLALEERRAGDRVRVGILREGRPRQVEVVLSGG
jgi:S1-C subfamily serine protease